ncbi:MAG: hypothetical protein ABIG93_04085 [archaeon]|nr:hypothetical protein [Nanoarchaeota archaeon]
MAKKKKITKKLVKKVASNTNAPKVNHSWTFPEKEFYLLRLESLTLVIITLAVFIFMLFQFEKRVFPSLIVTVVFLAVYFLISFVLKKLRNVQESYQVAKDHLQITKQVNKKSNKIKVPLKDVKSHKFDRTFLGAYLVTDKKRHPIYFNTLEELEKLEKWVLGKDKKSTKRKRK